MGIVEKFIKEGQLTKEEYPKLLHLYQAVSYTHLTLPTTVPV